MVAIVSVEANCENIDDLPDVIVQVGMRLLTSTDNNYVYKWFSSDYVADGIYKFMEEYCSVY